MRSISARSTDDLFFDYPHIEARARELQGESTARFFRNSARALGRVFRR